MQNKEASQITNDEYSEDGIYNPVSEPLGESLSISQQARMASAPPYLDGLNDEQRKAILTIEGPLLVLAGAGTGKTRVLTTRITHILVTGKARPSEILSVTFTNKAAREMKHRIGSLMGGVVEGMPWLGTFHSICVKLLRRHAELVGLKSNFTILDTDDQIRLLKQIIEAEDIDAKKWTPRGLAALIDGWKNRALTPDQVPQGDAMIFANGRGAELYELYQSRLKILNAVDFGDLLMEAIRLLRENDDILHKYRNQFKYILVDEYQDTNVAQYLWLRLLARNDGNICCVGDDDQSIYGWRGAEVDNILRFEKDFISSTVIRLEHNYRSTQHILNAASHLIAHNEERLGKTLRPDAKDGEKVTVSNVWDSVEEARSIGEDIERRQRDGICLNEMAILVRTSSQMREFEDRFVTMAIPYRVIGGPRFYERMEIRDALAYFRAVLQPADDLAFERIVNTPKRGLGNATLGILRSHARSEQIPLMAATAELVDTEEVKPKPRKTLRDLLESFARWRSQIDTLKHTELAEIILEESGYTEMWQRDKSIEAQGRLDNLKELIRSMDGFENMQGFLEHISLVLDSESQADEAKVNIMTLHSAKGLEFDVVYLSGWEEGLFPSQRSLDENGRAGLEEERRLAYVGITRAKKQAKIYFANNRRIHGMWQSTTPSRFVDELPAKDVAVIDASNSNNYNQAISRFAAHDMKFGGSYSTPGWQRAKQKKPTQAKREPQILEGNLIASSSEEALDFMLGERIFHQKFGYGKIIQIDGNKLSIDFEKAGSKKVVASFVEKV